MTVIRITSGPLRGVALETRRRNLIQRIGATFRGFLPCPPVRMVGHTDSVVPVEVPEASRMETTAIF